MDNKEKELVAKIMDFRRFAITLLCIGSFFFLGTILPAEENTLASTNGYMLASVAFLTASVVCFLQSSRYKKQLAESEQTDTY